MDNFDEITKVVNIFDINKAMAAVSIANLLSYEEMLKYLKGSRSAAGMLAFSSTQNPLSLLFSKSNSARQGFLEGWNNGYNESLRLFKEAAKYSWDPAFTISNLTNLYNKYEIKYKDAVVNNYSQSRSSFLKKYFYRSALCAIIDTWEKYTSYTG